MTAQQKQVLVLAIISLVAAAVVDFAGVSTDLVIKYEGLLLAILTPIFGWHTVQARKNK